MSVYEHLWAVKKVNNLTYKPLIAVGAVCRLSLEIQAITVNDKKLIVAGAGVGSSHTTYSHSTHYGISAAIQFHFVYILKS